ncbi:recombinase family protein [Paenibacillus sp. BC26]|uniref:recombinase family protein n=1 Tax=Paenibacillus sp. BC26 TaxID=1881032 RepID=UPI0008E1BB10|nr:recombinase family protein [Paenibacillus sp. BC26]SFS77868.1 Site-specific DNA recombinase [Paenibacillus sp. BC26]
MEYFSNVKRKKAKSGNASNRTPKAVIYVRVSDVKQVDGVSLDNQEKEIRSFLQSCTDDKGKNVSYEVVQVFREEGKSGKDQYRDQFQKMIEYVRDHRDEIDGVCFYAISRLGRNVRMVLETIDYFNKLDIAVLSKSDNLNSKTANGRFTLTILSALAQLESEQIAERVMPNMKYSVEELGRWQGARYVPYGYDHVKDPGDPKGVRKHLVVNLEEAKQVKQIFEWFCYGIGNDTNVGEYLITKHLNKIGWKYRKGKEWESRQITSIFQNGHLYAGWLVWNRHGTENKTVEAIDERGFVKDVEVMNYKNGFPKPVKVKYRKEEHEIVKSRGIHEAIITEALWQKCRERLMERYQKSKEQHRDTTRQAKHLFTHVLRCPDCGGSMGASRLGGVEYYKCQKSARGGNCRANLIQEEYLREDVLDVVLSHFEYYTYKRFDELVTKELNAEQYQNEAEAKLSDLEVRLKRADERISEIWDEFQSDRPDKLIKTREQASTLIRRIDSERDDIENEMETIRAELHEKVRDIHQVNEVVEKLNKFSDPRAYFDSLTPEGRLGFIDRYIHRIEFSKEHGKKGAHAYKITKIVLAPIFTDIFRRFRREDDPRNQSFKRAAYHARKEIGGAVDPEQSNLGNIMKIFDQRNRLPIYYTLSDGKERQFTEIKESRLHSFYNTINDEAKRQLRQFIRSDEKVFNIEINPSE